MQQSTLNPLRCALLLQLTALLLVLGWWLARGLAVPLVEPAATAGVLPCVSYAPFRRPGASPLDPHALHALVTPAQIEEDLRILKTRTNCVRTYGLGQGLDALPAIAARLGMRVRLGAWLSRDAIQNDLELERALALARQFRSTVELLIIGNEVLLRRELPPEQLALHLDYARKRSPVPVTSRTNDLSCQVPSNAFPSARASVDRHNTASPKETAAILLSMEHPLMSVHY